MELILIILVGCVMSFLITGSFMLGYHFGQKDIKKEEEGVHLNEYNKDFLAEMAKWANYTGKIND